MSQVTHRPGLIGWRVARAICSTCSIRSARRARAFGPSRIVGLTRPECEPGNGPGLHRHLNTVENFLYLSGRFEIAWGDQGEHTLVLEPLDMISVPRGENRSFRNVSNELGRLLVMIVPETDEQVDPISYALSLAKEIENEYGKTALEGLQKIGFKFEDEPTMS
jgi:mannose-6-phosphate isomerase-like protein (cupin superfamily)